MILIKSTLFILSIITAFLLGRAWAISLDKDKPGLSDSQQMQENGYNKAKESDGFNHDIHNTLLKMQESIDEVKRVLRGKRWPGPG